MSIAFGSRIVERSPGAIADAIESLVNTHVTADGTAVRDQLSAERDRGSPCRRLQGSHARGSTIGCAVSAGSSAKSATEMWARRLKRLMDGPGSIVGRMVRAMRFIRGRSAALGHRRLSIVDLALGSQPMANEDGLLWLVFNGEIYNHLNLRSRLVTCGHVFRTNSDSEVLLHGYEEWGAALFGQLNGIFALALFDGRRGPGEVVLVRDPVGAKPLYLGRSKSGWWFASELDAARTARPRSRWRFSPRPSTTSSCTASSRLPAPRTEMSGSCLRDTTAGCRLENRRASQRLSRTSRTSSPHQFLVVRASGKRPSPESSSRRRCGGNSCLTYRWGSLLSGGVDSTLVTHEMMRRVSPQTFAIGFAEAPHGGELMLARRAASVLGVPIREVAISEADYLEGWLRQSATLGEPISNTGMSLVGILCKSVRQTHKVVLTGQGADEPLGGYARHVAERVYPWLRPFRAPVSLMPERLLQSDRMARLRRVVGSPDQGRRFAEILAVFGLAEVAALSKTPTDPTELAAPVRVVGFPGGRGS